MEICNFKERIKKLHSFLLLARCMPPKKVILRFELLYKAHVIDEEKGKGIGMLWNTPTRRCWHASPMNSSINLDGMVEHYIIIITVTISSIAALLLFFCPLQLALWWCIWETDQQFLQLSGKTLSQTSRSTSGKRIDCLPHRNNSTP